jgi:polyhydroxyalkanoate synthesis regulator phasin
VSSIISGGVQAGATVAGGAATAATAAAAGGAAAAGTDAAKSGDSNPMGYFVDSLFRSSKGGARSASNASTEQSSAEVTRIFTNAVAAGKLPEEDARYVGQVVAQRTGMSQQDAEKRVNETFNQMQAKKQQAETAAREAADKARKASAMGALWLFISLLIGAFVASLSATYGGRRRDALT